MFTFFLKLSKIFVRIFEICGKWPNWVFFRKLIVFVKICHFFAQYGTFFNLKNIRKNCNIYRICQVLDKIVKIWQKIPRFCKNVHFFPRIRNFLSEFLSFTNKLSNLVFLGKFGNFCQSLPYFSDFRNLLEKIVRLKTFGKFFW